MQRTETVRVRVCRCGHEEDHHGIVNGVVESPSGSTLCLYGHGSASGGCSCRKFRSRGRAGVRAVLTPPVTTIDQILREMVRDEVARQLGARGVITGIPGTKHPGVFIPKRFVDIATEAKPNGSSSLAQSLRRIKNAAHPPVLQDIDRKLLQALATHGPSSHKRLAIITGYAQSGSFAAALTRLRKRQCIETTSDGIAITAVGRPLVSNGPLPTGQALMDYWSARLSTCAVSILEVLVRAYPNEVRTDQLAEATRYKASGSFMAAQTRLRHLGLVDGHRASREFVEAVRGGAS